MSKAQFIALFCAMGAFAYLAAAIVIAALTPHFTFLPYTLAMGSATAFCASYAYQREAWRDEKEKIPNG